MVFKAQAFLLEWWLSGAGQELVNEDNGRSGTWATESKFDNPVTRNILTTLQEAKTEGLLAAVLEHIGLVGTLKLGDRDPAHDFNQVAANGALVAPELARRKEPLESFPLDAMSVVGSIYKAGQPVVLVKVDNLLYQVKLGAYLGQNYGRVTKISETEVTLREIVQDAVGEWIERVATLQLQEKTK